MRMKLILALILIAFSPAAFSQATRQIDERYRKWLEKTPIYFSWTNNLTITRIDAFPIQGNLKTLHHAYLYTSTNKPAFMLFEDGNLSLDFPFKPPSGGKNDDLTKSGIFSHFSFSFHISQLVKIEKIVESFKSYRNTLEESDIFPISMSLGEVSHVAENHQQTFKHHFKFTIHVATDKRARLLIETGDTYFDAPYAYDLKILDEGQTAELVSMLKTLPNKIWWEQKAVGIIPSTQTNNTTTPAASAP